MTEPHMTATDLDLFAASYAPVACRHLDAIAALPEPWPPNAYGILAGVARLAVVLGARLHDNTPLDGTATDALVAAIVRGDREAPNLRAAVAALRAVLSEPAPLSGPARCSWASRVGLAGADLYAYVAGPIMV